MTKQHKESRFIPAKELRSIRNEDGTRSVSGYAAVFNALSVDMGGWQETLAPGCFTKSLMSNPNVVCLRDHDNSILLGRTRSKTLTLEQDQIGLRFDCLLPVTTQASDLIALIERGDIDGCSFSFICNKDDWKTTEDGKTIRTVIEAELFDVSVVSEPAYPDTSLALRNAPTEIRSMLADMAEKRDDDEEMEDDSLNTLCACPCDACVDGNCSDCSNADCDIADCDYGSSWASVRNYMLMQLELAKHRSK